MIVLTVVALASEAIPQLLGRQTATVTIIEILAPRDCRQNRSVLKGPKHRSEPSGFPGLYCGLVFTDHGSFALPQSSRFDLFQTPREALYDILQAGCRFEVIVAGSGPPLERGAMARNKGNKTLISARPVGDCEGGPEA